MKPAFNHEGSGLKRTLARMGITLGAVLALTVPTFSQNYPPGKLWVTFYPEAFDSLADSSGYVIYHLSYLDSVNIANECSTIVSDSVHGLDSTKYNYMAYFPENADIMALADAYMEDPRVQYARPDYYLEFLFTPNDALFYRDGSALECHQWNLDSTHCQFEKAWDITKGDTSVVIAMTDVGIFYRHPDLTGNLWINGPEDANGNGTFEPWRSDSSVPGDFDGVDDDGKGFIDDVVGWNFMGGNSTPYIDSIGGAGPSYTVHGTITSSVASAVTDNQIGVAGAGFNSRLMLVTGIPQGATISWAVKALGYAGLMGADVINMSWYSPGGDDPTLRGVIADLYSLGVTLVAAAGNFGQHVRIYPAGYFTTVISVAGTDSADMRHSISSYDESVDLSAPIKAWGAYVQGQYPSSLTPSYAYSVTDCGMDPPPDYPCELDDYDTLGCIGTGTSISAPLVAGTAALVKSAYPNMTNQQIMAKLRTSTDPIHYSSQDTTNGVVGKMGTGRLNAFKAVTFFDSIPRAASDTTLSGTVFVSGDIIVPAGKTLTLAPGTVLKFVPGDVMSYTGNPSSTKASIIVKGTLTCVGSQSDSIILTSFSSTPSSGDWGGILVAPNGNAELDFTRISYADTAISVWGDTATVIVYNSTFTHFNKAAVYSKSAKTKLGGIYPVPNPPDCGKNNFLMNTAASGAKAVIKSATPSGTIKAEGNWWTETPPQSGWFSGSVDRTPYLLGYASCDSCGGSGQNSEPPPEERISAKLNVPVSFELGQNYPNPFNPSTTIEYALPEAARVELKIYNILGQMVRKLVDEEKPVGYHQAVWDGKYENGLNVSTGIYLYQIKAGDFVETKKMQLIK